MSGRGAATSTGPQPLSTRWEWAAPELPEGLRPDVVLECGWGRIVFGQTFTSHEALRAALRGEESGQRDICVYPREPHVLVAQAPSELFLDPSHTYRLDLTAYRPADGDPAGGAVARIRPLRDAADVDAVNEIYEHARMLTADPALVLQNAASPVFTYLVAEDAEGSVVGTVTGVDHVRAFGDLEGGTSLWCLAVAPRSGLRGVGEALTRALAQELAGRGRAYVDLSVLHDNRRAISLYERVGFARVPVLSVKRKNGINEPLFVGPASPDHRRLNPYARIVADEARRRGIAVEVRDAEWGELRLTRGTRSVTTRESLSELTSAVAMSRCDDKRITRRVLEGAGLRVARGRTATTPEQDAAFLAEVGDLVVKPARGEQGRGITVGVTDPFSLTRAVDEARRHCPDVLLEERCDGEDLRVLVIDHSVVAAAIRIPATVVGDGSRTIGQLIAAHSRRREAETGGESRIPLDEGTHDTVRHAGHTLDSVLPEGVSLRVRRTANLHTGGTIHDVTAALHPDLAEACTRASRALEIPVTGLDLLVPRPDGPEHVFVEANERPGLANHEPQPTAARFLDLLFPGSEPRA